MKKLLTLSFIPPLHDLSLLVLRATVGVSMLLLHGYDKLMPLRDDPRLETGWHATLKKLEGSFSAPLPACAILAESVGAALIVVGLFTRWAALALAIAMGVAFFKAHAGDLKEGELAFLYMSASAAILLAGPGRISVDATVLKSQTRPRDFSGR